MGLTDDAPDTLHVALLRGINVGGNNRLRMSDLLALCTDAGYPDARAYIQSGNLLFRATPAAAADFPSLLTARIADRFGLRVPILVRTAAEIAAVVRDNPFPSHDDTPETMLHIVFLAQAPPASAVATLDPAAALPETFAVRGREIYLLRHRGVARSLLTNAYFDTKLATTSTVRNWRTVTTLHTMMTDA